MRFDRPRSAILFRGVVLFVAILLCAPLGSRAQEEESSETTPLPTPASPSPPPPQELVTPPPERLGPSPSPEATSTPAPQVTNASGKEVLSGAGAEATSSSGKEIVPRETTSEGGAPLGTGKFQRFPFHVSVSVREGYDDNVYTTTLHEIGSWFTNGSAVIDYNFGSARTQLDLRAVGGFTYYYHRPLGQEYDVNSSLTLSLSHRATPRLTVDGSAYLAYQSEPDFNTSFGVNRFSGNFFYTADKIAAGYQWTPRFSTLTSYTLGFINYENSVVGAYEDRFEHTFGNEFRFLALPTTTLVAEYRYEIVDFDQSPRDSTSHFVLGGLDHTFNPCFNLSLRTGAEFRDIENFGERTSPYGEMTLRYAAGKRSSISWVNRYGLEEPDVPFSPSRKTFRTGLSIDYGILPRVTATLAAFYEHDDNEGVTTPSVISPPFTEESIDISVGIRYEINRVLAALAGYSHTEVFSDIPLREYTRNRYYLGLNAAF